MPAMGECGAVVRAAAPADRRVRWSLGNGPHSSPMVTRAVPTCSKTFGYWCCRTRRWRGKALKATQEAVDLGRRLAAHLGESVRLESDPVRRRPPIDGA